MIDTAIGGMKTRFTNHGKNPTVLVLASSKRSEKSFLETHLKKKLQTEKENTFIVDEPVWNIRPASEYSGKRFKVALGNRYLASEIIPKDIADIKPYIDKGYKIIDVPEEYLSAFRDDIDRALCDYAGISSSDSTKYISGTRLQAVKHSDIHNPFMKDILEVGNAPDDFAQYCDFFDMSKVPRDLLYKPLFIHLDMSTSGDMTGIAGIWIIGKKPTQEGQLPSKDLFYRLAFSVSIKAPKGYQISFEKNRQFIYWLKEMGFNIKSISTDSFQSTDMSQTLIAHNYNYQQISVDRVSPDHINHPYQNFKSVLYEERIQLYDSELLTTEILQLERLQSGKIEHENEGRSGSKDQCDALVGALYAASQTAEEYAFDYGENYDTMFNVNADYSVDVDNILNDLTMSMLNSPATVNSLQSEQSISAFSAPTTPSSYLSKDSDILFW